MPELAAPAPKPADPEPDRHATPTDAGPDPGATLLAGAVGPGGAGPRLSGHAGRDRAVLRSVQRRAGNAAAVSLVRRRAPGSPSPSVPLTAGASTAPSPARAIPGPATLQRATAVQRAPATIDGTKVATYADLDRWYGVRTKILTAQKNDLTSNGLPAPAVINKAISTGESNAAACREDPAGELDAIRAVAAQGWLENEFRKAINAAEAVRGFAVASRVGTITAAMRRAETALRTDTLNTLRDVQHKAYLKESDEGLAATADAIANVIDTGLVLKDGITNAAKTQRELVSIANVAFMNQGQAPPLNSNRWVTRIGETMEAANKAYAGIQLVRAALDLAGGGKTASDQGTAAVKAMSTVISAGGSLLGASTGMTVYANLYLGPAIDQCLKALDRLKDVGREINRTNMEQGLYDKVNWDLEPGGRALFDFMRAVMKAGSAGDIPDPIPPSVASYLGENAEELATGAKAEEMETTGFWFWKKADPKWAKYWIYRNRSSLWGMFYGSLVVRD